MRFLFVYAWHNIAVFVVVTRGKGKALYSSMLTAYAQVKLIARELARP